MWGSIAGQERSCEPRVANPHPTVAIATMFPDEPEKPGHECRGLGPGASFPSGGRKGLDEDAIEMSAREMTHIRLSGAPTLRSGVNCA